VPWHAAKLRLTRVFFPLGFVALVRAGSPDPPVLCDRRSPCPRPTARHLETHGRPKGDCSLSATSVNRRGPPSMPRAELGTVLPTRRGVNMLRSQSHPSMTCLRCDVAIGPQGPIFVCTQGHTWEIGPGTGVPKVCYRPFPRRGGQCKCVCNEQVSRAGWQRRMAVLR